MRKGINMSTTKKNKHISVDDYLADERYQDIKHEYVNGQAYAMAGASQNHGRISGNVFRKIGNHLENASCEPFIADMKVKTSTGNYRYPDVVITCDNNFIDNGCATKTPVILVEVLSRSTRKIDEKDKLLEYINIPSLKEYMIIEQDVVDVTVYRKSDDWRSIHYFMEEDIYFESIDFTLSVEDICHRVENEDVSDFLKQKLETT